MTPSSAHKMFYNFKGYDLAIWIMIIFYFTRIMRTIILKRKIIIRKNSIKRMSFMDFFMLSILAIILFYMIVNQFNMSKCKEMITYLYGIGIYFMIRIYFKSNKYVSLIKILNLSVIFSSIIILFIYFTKDVSSLGLLDWEGRYVNAFQTIYIITIPIMIYWIINEKHLLRVKIGYGFGVILELYLLSINGNRMITILMGLFLAIILIKITANSFYYKDPLNFIKRNMYVMAIIGIVVILIIYLFNTQSLIITRIIESISGVGSARNIDTRMLTNTYNIKLLKENIWGYGVGEKMYMVNYNGAIYSIRSFIDNAFISIAFKFGIISILFMVIFFLNIFKIAINDVYKKKFEFILYIIFFMLGITGGMLTSQIITNTVISFSFWMIIAIIIDENRKELTLM